MCSLHQKHLYSKCTHCFACFTCDRSALTRRYCSKAMSQVEGQEYTYIGDFPQSSLIPLHHTHGSPGMSNSFGHRMRTEYSRMEEYLRAEDYATYRLVHPLTCDQLPPGAQLSSAPYPKYLLAQTSPYPHFSSPWPAQEAYHYGMPSVSSNFCIQFVFFISNVMWVFEPTTFVVSPTSYATGTLCILSI